MSFLQEPFATTHCVLLHVRLPYTSNQWHSIQREDPANPNSPRNMQEAHIRTQKCTDKAPDSISFLRRAGLTRAKPRVHTAVRCSHAVLCFCCNWPIRWWNCCDDPRFRSIGLHPRPILSSLLGRDQLVQLMAVWRVCCVH